MRSGGCLAVSETAEDRTASRCRPLSRRTRIDSVERSSQGSFWRGRRENRQVFRFGENRAVVWRFRQVTRELLTPIRDMRPAKEKKGKANRKVSGSGSSQTSEGRNPKDVAGMEQAWQARPTRREEDETTTESNGSNQSDRKSTKPGRAGNRAMRILLGNKRSSDGTTQHGMGTVLW